MRDWSEGLQLPVTQANNQRFNIVMHRLQSILLSSILLTVSAHMKLTNPPPRGSGSGDYPVEINMERPFYLDNPGEGPILTFPCGGKTRKGPSVMTYKAGETVNVEYQGGLIY